MGLESVGHWRASIAARASRNVEMWRMRTLEGGTLRRVTQTLFQSCFAPHFISLGLPIYKNELLRLNDLLTLGWQERAWPTTREDPLVNCSSNPNGKWDVCILQWRTGECRGKTQSERGLEGHKTSLLRETIPRDSCGKDILGVAHEELFFFPY